MSSCQISLSLCIDRLGEGYSELCADKRALEPLIVELPFLFLQLPGRKYDVGYNADVGDKWIWLK